MREILIACQLQAAPNGRLPPWGGLLDSAEEHGLMSFILGPDGVRPLAQGLLRGRFEDEAAALAAFDAALAGASELLGYQVRVHRRMACAAGGEAPEFPFAQAEAPLYLPYQ